MQILARMDLREILYAFTSMGNNNGSAFAGLNANTPFYNIIRWDCDAYYRVIGLPFRHLLLQVLWLGKKLFPTVQEHLQHIHLFLLFFLVSVTIIIGALIFSSCTALGPIVEHLNALGTIWPLNHDLIVGYQYY